MKISPREDFGILMRYWSSWLYQQHLEEGAVQDLRSMEELRVQSGEAGVPLRCGGSTAWCEVQCGRKSHIRFLLKSCESTEFLHSVLVSTDVCYTVLVCVRLCCGVLVCVRLCYLVL